MFDDSSIIAIIAALVAMLSALYARWQAAAAGRANEIALHENRLKIYKGLSRFRAHIITRGSKLNEEEIWQFSEIVELSEFYFSADIHTHLNTVLEQAMELLWLNDEWEDAKQNSPEHAKNLVSKRHELMKTTRNECCKIREVIKQHLRVGRA